MYYGTEHPRGAQDYLLRFLARYAAAFARLPHTAMLHHRWPWAFVLPALLREKKSEKGRTGYRAYREFRHCVGRIDS